MSDRVADGQSAGAGVVDVTNATGAGDVILVCEHASNFIPGHFDALGLSPDARESHVAWDPGALPVTTVMSAALDAPLFSHRVSRLVFDCNRDPASADAILEKSEDHEIPGNQGLSEAERRSRAELFYAPFRDAISACLDQRINGGSHPVLVTVHSFVPVYEGTRRDFDIGILHDEDTRLAEALLERFAEDGDLDVRRNQPYGPSDGVTHTLVEHALRRGLLNVMVEIRSDLIAGPADQKAMAERLATYLDGALGALLNTPAKAGETARQKTSTELANDQVETA